MARQIIHNSSAGKDQIQGTISAINLGMKLSFLKDQMQGAISAINLGMKLSFLKPNLKNRRQMLKLLTMMIRSNAGSVKLPLGVIGSPLEMVSSCASLYIYLDY